MRMAFTLIGGKNWTGGHNYLVNLLRTLGQHQSDRLTPILFVGEECRGADVTVFAELPGVEIVHTALLNASRRSLTLIKSLLLGRDTELLRLLHTHRIDIVFENAQFLGWRLGLPAIAWIPDFQHRELPRMFPMRARWKREIGFQTQVMGRRFIMLSSEDARRACESHYPATHGRTRTIHFAVPPGTEVSLAEARAIAGGYGLPEQFFFMPNQFWKHKNHILVIEALAILKKRGKSMVIAASGKQSDPRDPEHFPRLQALVDRLGLQEEMRFLGMIPYPHLSALMRACTALLNPSLFEGWSTTVEEARSQGTPMLLSDLNVHREQMAENATYFDRHSPHSLAEALESFMPMDLAERENRIKAARCDAEQRVWRFSEEFADLAITACKNLGH